MLSVLPVIFSLQPAPAPSWGESPAEYRERAELIDRAIVDATEGRRKLALAVVVVFHGESRFSLLVQSGEHRGDGGRALCMGQAHRGGLSEAEWLSLIGTDYDSIRRCALVTANRLIAAYRYCHSYPGAFVLYGTGRTCDAGETRWAGLFRDRGAKWERFNHAD